MNKLGIHFTCFDEINATRYSLSSALSVYPEIKIRLFSEGDNFKFLENEFKNLKTSIEKDTLTKTFNITDENFLKEIHQESMYVCAKATLERLRESCDFCESEYIIMMDPDTVIRGGLNIPNGSKILGSRINSHLPLLGVNEVLSTIEGATNISCWGATPGIFEVETLKNALTLFEERDTLLKEFCSKIYAIYAHDLLLPILFASQGFQEEFNPDICECHRDLSWETNKKPLLHQYKFLYA